MCNTHASWLNMRTLPVVITNFHWHIKHCYQPSTNLSWTTNEPCFINYHWLPHQLCFSPPGILVAQLVPGSSCQVKLKDGTYVHLPSGHEQVMKRSLWSTVSGWFMVVEWCSHEMIWCVWCLIWCQIIPIVQNFLSLSACRSSHLISKQQHQQGRWAQNTLLLLTCSDCFGLQPNAGRSGQALKHMHTRNTDNKWSFMMVHNCLKNWLTTLIDTEPSLTIVQHNRIIQA